MYTYLSSIAEKYYEDVLKHNYGHFHAILHQSTKWTITLVFSFGCLHELLICKNMTTM